MIVDHLGFGVSDYARAKAFYSAALAPLGITLVMEVGPELTEGGNWACGFGKNDKPELWIGSDGKTTPPIHVAFVVETRAEVRAFHDAALKAGARDNGGPGLRHTIIRTTMQPSSSISTATISRPSAMPPNDRHAERLQLQSSHSGLRAPSTVISFNLRGATVALAPGIAN